MSAPFRFLDPHPLQDRDLTLVAPTPDLIDTLLHSVAHPLTQRDEPEQASLTREQLQSFLERAPGGHVAPTENILPGYVFWMICTAQNAPLRCVGRISVRITQDDTFLRYWGHMGYFVYPASRGQHFAERSCRLLFPLLRRHGIQTLWVTCNPDNIASQKTCDRLGMVYVDRIAVPENHALHARGETQKVRYRMNLGK